MNKTAIFVMGLIGSIIGMVGTVFWFGLGPYFFGGMVDWDMPLDAPLTEDALTIGTTIVIIQSIITLAVFVVGLVKSTPSSLDRGLKNSGVWLLVLGICMIFINVVHIISAILYIIAGAVALQRAVNEKQAIAPESFYDSNEVN